MSNLTDGKKALRDGDFKTAELKLLKALDNHPDDGELWWSVMLCKSGYRSDAELSDAVKKMFIAAAKTDGRVPPTPFESPYCKNALRYERDGRRAEYIKSLYSELEPVWLEYTHKHLPSPVSVKPMRTHTRAEVRYNVLSALTYIGIAVALCFGILGVYGLYVSAAWAMWTGFVGLGACIAASFAARHAAVKAGGRVKASAALIVTVLTAVSFAVLGVGVIAGNRTASIIGGAALGIILAFAVTKIFMKARGNGGGNKSTASKSSNEKNAAVSSRDPYLLARAARGDKGVKPNKNKGVENDYQDEFD